MRAELVRRRYHDRAVDRLSDADRVAEGIAERAVGAVEALCRFLRELDARRAQAVVRCAAVVGLVTSSRICAAVASSYAGGPGSIRTSSRSGWSGTLSVKKRMTPMSASVWTTMPSLPT